MFLRGLIVGSLLLAVALLSSAVHAQEPLSIEDMRALRKERKLPHEIVKIAQEEGLDFQIDLATERILRRMGFSRSHLKKLKKVAEEQEKKELPELGPQKRRDELLKKHGKDIPADAEAEEDGDAEAAPNTNPVLASKMAENDRQIKEIIKKSSTGAKIHAATHTRLIGKPELIKPLLPVVKRWESLAAKRFPGPVGNGIDARGVNIALFKTEYEFRRWVNASFDVYEESGIRFSSPNVAERAFKSKAYFFDGTFSALVSNMRPDEIQHRVVFASAHLGILQLTNDGVPDAIGTGFGNLAETMVFNDQFITVQSGYRDRDLGKEATTWPQRVQKQFKLNKIGSIQNVFVYTTEAMELPQYALGWSLTILLAKDEMKFSKWVELMGEGERPYEALEKAYQLDDKAVMARWRRFVRSQR